MRISRYVRGQGAEPGVTFCHPAAGKLPPRRQGEEPHPGQAVGLALGQGGRPRPGAEGPAVGRGPGRGVRDHPQPAARPRRRRVRHGAPAGPGGADRPGPVRAAGPGDRDGGRAGDRAGFQAGHRRGLRDQTAASSLGDVLGVGGCDEDDLYAAMDYLHDRQDTIQDALAARHLAGGTLVCMTSPLPRSRAGPARWAPSATPRTGCGAGCRSSTGCWPPLRASRSPSRCSSATSGIPRRWPPR